MGTLGALVKRGGVFHRRTPNGMLAVDMVSIVDVSEEPPERKCMVCSVHVERVLEFACVPGPVLGYRGACVHAKRLRMHCGQSTQQRFLSNVTTP